MNQYFVIYKPFDMLSQFTREHPSHKTLADLDLVFDKDIYPVGRLDRDSEGLLLLTNDKRLNALLLHPTNKKTKTYLVQVDGQIDHEAIQKLQQGVPIKVNKKIYQTLPCDVRYLEKEPELPDRIPPVRYRKNIPTSWIEIKLNEGKNRQVRKMTAAVGFPTLRLVRSELGPLSIHGMASADIRTLDKSEIDLLFNL